MSQDDRTIQPATSGRHSTVPAVLAATVALHPDASRIGDVLLLMDAHGPGSRQVSRLEPAFRNPAGEQTGPLQAPTISRKPCTFELLGDGRLRLASPPDGTKLRVRNQPVDAEHVVEAEALEQGVAITLGESVVLLLHRFVPFMGESPSLGLIGESAAMRQLRADVLRVADLDVPVLLRGESGVGKELLARAIHEHSKRAEKTYVPVNMAAIPASMAAAELFGHERGAFTGAAQKRPGYFVQADGGTLFLDEVGDLAPEVQPLMLRALESGEVQTVGATAARKVDVRVVAATDSNLEHAIDRGEFRLPLLQRLSGYELRVPPLRDRRDDIGRLVLCFARRELEKAGEPDRFATEGPKSWLPARVMVALLGYDWPGNVRELGNVVRQLVISNRGRDKFRLDAALEKKLGALVGGSAESPSLLPVAAVEAQPSGETLRPAPTKNARELTDDDIVAAMRAAEFRIAEAAQALGVSRSWLNGRVERCPGIRKSTELTESQVREALAVSAGDVAHAARTLEVSERALVLQMKRLGVER